MKKHIEAYYTKQKPKEGTKDDAESVIPTFYLRGMKYCHEKIQKGLGSDGFKKIKTPLLLVWDISTIAYTIFNIEFSLRMNNIHNIYNMWTADQLIPVIIGLGGIFNAVIELYLHKRGESRKKAVLLWGAGTHEQTTQTLPEKTHDKKAKAGSRAANQLERRESSSNSAEITTVHVDSK